MGRLKEAFLERVDSFADRVLDVVDAIESKCRSSRVIDQMTGAGTAVGANIYEADEAMSGRDFCKCVAISLKELNETRFWLRLAVRRSWIPARRLTDLHTEAQELKRIMGSMIARSRNGALRRA